MQGPTRPKIETVYLLDNRPKQSFLLSVEVILPDGEAYVED